jgi:hypothetical protein
MTAHRVGAPKTPKVETPKKHPGLAAMADFMKLSREQQAKHGENEKHHARNMNKGWHKP